MANHDTLKLLRYADLVELGVIPNRTTLARWIKAGRWPAPLRLGPNFCAWKLSEIEAHLERLAAEREATAKKVGGA